MAACKRCCFWPGWKQIVCEYFFLVRVWPAGFRAVNSLWTRCELAVNSLWGLFRAVNSLWGLFRAVNSLWTRCGGGFGLWTRCELLWCGLVPVFHLYLFPTFLASVFFFSCFRNKLFWFIGLLKYVASLPNKKRIYLFVSRITFFDYLCFN